MGHSDFTAFFNYLLQAFADNSESHNRRFKIVRTVINEMRERNLQSAVNKEIVTRLCMELPKFRNNHLIALCSLCSELIQIGNSTYT